MWGVPKDKCHSFTILLKTYKVISPSFIHSSIHPSSPWYVYYVFCEIVSGRKTEFESQKRRDMIRRDTYKKGRGVIEELLTRRVTEH